MEDAEVTTCEALPAADEAQQTLEQRARALTSPHSAVWPNSGAIGTQALDARHSSLYPCESSFQAAWLLSHWLEQCNSSEVSLGAVPLFWVADGAWPKVYVQCQGASGSQGGAEGNAADGSRAEGKTLAGARAWQLSFQQVLLRSSAFEPRLHRATMSDAWNASGLGSARNSCWRFAPKSHRSVRPSRQAGAESLLRVLRAALRAPVRLGCPALHKALPLPRPCSSKASLYGRQGLVRQVLAHKT